MSVVQMPQASPMQQLSWRVADAIEWLLEEFCESGRPSGSGIFDK